jgi:hypothetical protein
MPARRRVLGLASHTSTERSTFQDRELSSPPRRASIQPAEARARFGARRTTTPAPDAVTPDGPDRSGLVLLHGLIVRYSREARKGAVHLAETSDRGKPGSDPTRVGGVPVYVVKKGSKPSVLRLIKGPGAPADYSLDLAEMVIGRAVDVHISIHSDSISRRHAALKQQAASVLCEDLASSNGIYVNGEKVGSAELKDGDSLQIGDALFVYKAGS